MGWKIMKKCLIVILCGLMPVLMCAEEEPRKYTLDDCVRIGLERSAAAANARRDQIIADAKVTQARSQALPHFSVSANYTRLDELQEINLGDESVELGTLDNYSVLAEVNQLLYSGGKVRAALKAADLSEEHARWSKADTDARLVRNIKTSFNNILLSQEAVKVRKESLGQLEGLLKQTQEKLREGLVSEFDVISARVKLGNEKPFLINAINAYEVAKENFRRLLNLDDKPFGLDGKLEFDPVGMGMEQFESKALADHPGIRVMEALFGLREQDVDAARAQYLPNVSMFGTYNGANSYRFVSFDDDWEWHWNAGLSLTWNFWDGGLTRGLVAEKALELEKAGTDLADFKKVVKLQVRQAYLDMCHAREAVESGKGNVELAEKAMEIASARYKTGMATYLEFTDANVALSRASLTYFTALRDHMNAVARLQYASAGKLR